MTKSAPHHRSRVDRVIQFFREASADERLAIQFILSREGLLSAFLFTGTPKQARRKRRGNDADVNSSANSQPDRAEGANA